MDLHIRQSLREHRLYWTVAISLLLHLLFLLFYTDWGRYIVFRLPEQESMSHRPPLAFEIIESKSNTDKEPDQVDFLSDQNAMASDLHSENFQQSNLPFSNGQTPNKNLETALPSQMQKNPSPSQDQDNGAEDSEEKVTLSASERKSTVRSGFSREQLLASNATASNAASRPLYQQQSSSADDLGGLSFNTYAWEYGPYLLDLKRRIEKNIFPPPIYTRMGIGGSNLIRFRIMPDGQLVGPDLINALGEKSLIATSENAVLYSAPFKPLPEDFPEAYLEVTARFEYMILNNP
ncbi:hypothetical protein HQ585_01670 [candidate division KSB1 bacterium]|nr:hypothetical protein [candidate division KSB1 bacterium]